MNNLPQDVVSGEYCVRDHSWHSKKYPQTLHVHSSFSVRKDSENSSHTVKVLRNLCTPVLAPGLPKLHMTFTLLVVNTAVNIPIYTKTAAHKLLKTSTVV